MSKLHQGNNKLKKEYEQTYLYFNCLGCHSTHCFAYPLWNWNMSFENPTVSPSIKVTYHDKICHLFIRDGKLCFCNDSWHQLAGKEVDMVDWDSIWFAEDE